MEKIRVKGHLGEDGLRKWIATHQFQLALFNGFLMLMILLRSAGYFEPFIPLTINLIFASALVLSVFLLDTTSRGAVSIALIFWVIAGLLRVLSIEVWAERAAVYSFEALLLSIFLFIIEEAVLGRRGRQDEKRS